MLNVIYKPATLERMAQSREHKAQTRERILSEASGRLRTDGVAGVSIAQLMTAAGLTHGGFYRHFESREDLIAQATARALVDGAAAGARARAGHGPTLAAYVKGYLSRSHRDAPGNGCAIAALAADVPHAGAPTSAVFTQGLKAALDRLAAQFDTSGSAAASEKISQTEGVAKASESAHEQAMVLLSTMVGALVLARAVDDANLSDQLLAASRTRLMAQVSPTPSDSETSR